MGRAPESQVSAFTVFCVGIVGICLAYQMERESDSDSVGLESQSEDASLP